MFQRYFKKLNKDTSFRQNDEDEISLAVSVILLEIAHADDVFSNEEKKIISQVLKKYFNLDETQVNNLLEISESEREHAIDLWHYTHLINKEYTHKDKVLLIENIWQIIFSDGRMDGFENALVHKLSELLHVPHSEFIAVKLQVMKDGNIIKT